jgi:transposase
MERKRRSCDAEFKLQLARIVRDQGPRLGQVCRDMNVGETAVRRWVSRVVVFEPSCRISRVRIQLHQT